MKMSILVFFLVTAEREDSTLGSDINMSKIGV